RAGEHHRGHRRRGGPHPAPRGAALAVPPDRRPRRRGLAGPEGGSGPDAHLRDPAGGPDALPSPGAVRNPGDLGRGAAVVRSLPEEDGVSELLLQTVDAGIEFGGLRALQGFNLEIRQGDLKGLIGPNGAGKTTAFNILTGVYQPTHGEIRVLGEMVNGRKPHQINHLGVARTFQNIRLFRALSALDNVRVASLPEETPLFSRGTIDELRRKATGGWSAPASALDALNNYVDWWRALLLTPGFQREEAELTRRADALLEVMGLAHRRNEEARNLPYGEQRRLEIARALGTRPRVLLLDEPAAGMNTPEEADLMLLIRQLS